MKIVRIPTINDSISDFDTLFRIWKNLNRDNVSVRLDFTYCDFLRQNAVAFLGGVIRLVENRGGTITIDQTTLRAHVKKNLIRNNFLGNFGENAVDNNGNAIFFRQDIVWNKVKIMEYLKNQWLGQGWVHVSVDLAGAIVGKVAEIYLNSFEHSASKIGVFSCGQYYPKLNKLILTVVDFGIGIPANVKDFLGLTKANSSKTLEWAFQSGNTTKPKEISRGLGLGILKDFVKKNDGCLEVFSHDGYVRINSDNELYQDWDSFFGGTLINITLNCDEAYYVLSGETKPKFLF